MDRSIQSSRPSFYDKIRMNLAKKKQKVVTSSSAKVASSSDHHAEDTNNASSTPICTNVSSSDHTDPPITKHSTSVPYSDLKGPTIGNYVVDADTTPKPPPVLPSNDETLPPLVSSKFISPASASRRSLT